MGAEQLLKKRNFRPASTGILHNPPEPTVFYVNLRKCRGRNCTGGTAVHSSNSTSDAALRKPDTYPSLRPVCLTALQPQVVGILQLAARVRAFDFAARNLSRNSERVPMHALHFSKCLNSSTVNSNLVVAAACIRSFSMWAPCSSPVRGIAFYLSSFKRR